MLCFFVHKVNIVVQGIDWKTFKIRFSTVFFFAGSLFSQSCYIWNIAYVVHCNNIREKWCKNFIRCDKVTIVWTIVIGYLSLSMPKSFSLILDKNFPSRNNWNNVCGSVLYLSAMITIFPLWDIYHENHKLSHVQMLPALGSMHVLVADTVGTSASLLR